MSVISLGLADRLLKNYISGKGRISEKKLEELENNPVFMMQAIEKSGDPKLYRLCSHNVKTNYKFIKYYVQKFPNEIELIDKAAKYYLTYTKDGFDTFELSVIMKRLTYHNKEICVNYGMKAEGYALIDDCSISIITEDIKDSAARKKFGLGFSYLQDLYYASEDIIDYHARRKIKKRFDENLNSIETELHRIFKKPEFLILAEKNKTSSFGLVQPKYSVTQYFVDYFLKCDQALSLYIQLNPEVLSSLKERIENIKDQWCFYEKNLKDSKFNQILTVYDEYMNGICIPYDENYYDLLKSIKDNLDISDELLNYDDDLCYMDYDEFICASKSINMEKHDKKALEDLQELIRQILNEDNLQVIENIHYHRCRITSIKGSRKRGSIITQL